jgi:hypothetical protein
MSDTKSSSSGPMELSHEETISALFANLVIQQTNLALMFLGRVPHPETGETVQDLENARVFIDQLEMIEVKTKGNLDKREDQLLKQSLTTLRMAFVEAINSPAPAASKAAEQPSTIAPTGTAQSSTAATGQSAADSSPQQESHKKFSKKY